MSENLFETLCRSFSPRLDEPFLCPPGEAPSTYASTLDRAARFARILQDAGAQTGDRVAVQVDKSPDAIAAYLACLQRGLVYLPLNPAYTPQEVQYYLEDAEPTVLVCRPSAEPDLAPRASATGVRSVLTLGTEDGGTLGDAARSARPLPDVAPREAGDLAAMLYTSGTTGKPKGAMITHDNLATNARALFETWGWREDDVLLHALPVFHVHGLFVALHCALLGGSRVEFLSRFDVAAVREALPRSTVLMGVPTFYARLLAEPTFGQDGECEHMRLFISGSAPLTESTSRAFFERTGHRVLERYGMTETGILTSNPLVGARLEGTVGYPLPGVEVRIVDDRGEPCAPGETGAVEVRGRGVFRGYWRNPEKTRSEHTADGFFRTGDLGAQSEDGRVALIGRTSDLIISGGYNVYPKEIELCLDEIPGVEEVAVVGLPHPDLGEAVAAFIVCGETPELDARNVGDALADRLARFKQPRHVEFLDALPRNAMGKVQKAVLRRDFAHTFESGSDE